MTKKQFLQRAWQINQTIEALTDRIEMLRTMATRTTQTIDDMPHGSGVKSKVEEMAVKIVALEEKAISENYKLVEILSEITEAIDHVKDNECRTLLQRRYIDCLTWEEIADLLGWSLRNVHRVHGKALNILDISKYGT